MFQILPAIDLSTLHKVQHVLSLMQISFHMCERVYDRKSLLSSAAFCNPDIIFLDLQLKDMEDSSILQQLKEQLPYTELIVISGRHSFREIYTALHCQISEFLCKPVNDQELYLAISRIQHKLNSNGSYNSSLERKKFIGKLFIEYAKKLPGEKQLTEPIVNGLYQTHFVPGAYRIINVRLESEDGSAGRFDPVIKRITEILFNRLEALCCEILFNINPLQSNILLNYESVSESPIHEGLLKCLKKAVDMLPNGMFCTFCCSNMHFSITEMPDMLEETANTMWSRFYRGKNTVLYPEAETPFPPRLQRLYDETEQHLKTACSTLNIALFERTLERFFARPDSVIGRYQTRELIRRVEYYMLDVNRNLISSFADITQTGIDIKQSIQTANNLQEYKKYFASQMLLLFQQILTHHGQQSQPIRNAQHYIKEHYSSSIQLSAVAEYVGLTPPYLSARFKEELGIGFVDYLNQFRIDISKKLLLETEEKIVAIAQMVGYKNARYYSRVFRNLEGIRPTDYRTCHRRSTIP